MSSSITDPQVLAFIERIAALGGSFTNPSVEQVRADYDHRSAVFRQPRPAGITVEDGTIAGPGGPIPVRTYRPQDPARCRIVFFHGGGFVLGGLESHDDVCAEWALAAGAELTAVDYRLAPEHRHPASYEDALAAVDALSDRPIVVAGDSAGGNLAAGVSRARPDRIAGQVLIYPMLGGNMLDLASYIERAEAPMLTAAAIGAFNLHRLGDRPEPDDDPTFSPLLADSVAGLPPAFISVAEFDPLRDDGIRYAERLREAGVAAEIVVEDQLIHGHVRARTTSDRAAAAFGRIGAALADMVRAAG